QYIQQAFFFARIEKITSNGRLAAVITAVLFGLAHLPSPVLAPVTLVGGWILSELFGRYRSLYPLAVAHGLIGLAIAVSVPDSIHHHMRVGLGYLRYPNYVTRFRVWFSFTWHEFLTVSPEGRPGFSQFLVALIVH